MNLSIIEAGDADDAQRDEEGSDTGPGLRWWLQLVIIRPIRLLWDPVVKQMFMFTVFTVNSTFLRALQWPCETLDLVGHLFLNLLRWEEPLSGSESSQGDF